MVSSCSETPAASGPILHARCVFGRRELKIAKRRPKEISGSPQPRVAAHPDRVLDCTCGLNSEAASCLYKDAHQHRRGHGEPAPKLDSPARPRHPSEHVDLYARLGLSASPPPTAAEIRLAYRAGILRAHPDRLVSSTDGARDGPAVSTPSQPGTGAADDAHELNEAWEVLGDEEARSRYDAARRAWIVAQRATTQSFAVSHSLDAFEAHYQDHPTSERPELLDEPAYYTHPCRCSSEFRITREQLEAGVEIVTCDGCSERCRVEYEVVEE